MKASSDQEPALWTKFYSAYGLFYPSDFSPPQLQKLKYSASRYIGPNVKGHHFTPVYSIGLKLWGPIDLISAFCVSKFQNRISYQKKVTAQTICPAIQNILKNLDEKFLFFCGGEFLVTLQVPDFEHIRQFFKIKFVLNLVPPSQKL